MDALAVRAVASGFASALLASESGLTCLFVLGTLLVGLLACWRNAVDMYILLAEIALNRLWPSVDASVRRNGSCCVDISIGCRRK